MRNQTIQSIGLSQGGLNPQALLKFKGKNTGSTLSLVTAGLVFQEIKRVQKRTRRNTEKYHVLEKQQWPCVSASSREAIFLTM